MSRLFLRLPLSTDFSPRSIVLLFSAPLRSLVPSLFLRFFAFFRPFSSYGMIFLAAFLFLFNVFLFIYFSVPCRCLFFGISRYQSFDNDARHRCCGDWFLQWVSSLTSDGSSVVLIKEDRIPGPDLFDERLFLCARFLR